MDVIRLQCLNFIHSLKVSSSNIAFFSRTLHVHGKCSDSENKPLGVNMFVEFGYSIT